jgi:hypothetical protein
MPCRSVLPAVAKSRRTLDHRHVDPMQAQLIGRDIAGDAGA